MTEWNNGCTLGVWSIRLGSQVWPRIETDLESNVFETIKPNQTLLFSFLLKSKKNLVKQRAERANGSNAISGYLMVAAVLDVSHAPTSSSFFFFLQLCRPIEVADSGFLYHRLEMTRSRCAQSARHILAAQAAPKSLLAVCPVVSYRLSFYFSLFLCVCVCEIGGQDGRQDGLIKHKVIEWKENVEERRE